jgi:hypothetical protein
MMLLGYLLLALLVAALVFYGVVALLPNGLSLTPQRDNRPFELPADRRMVREDLDRVRIPVGVRGYKFAETDDLIDRLAAEIVVRDEEIERLRSQAQDGLAAQGRPLAPQEPRPGEYRPATQDQPAGRQVPPGESPAAADNATEL